jgi:hypothetical protein
MKIIGSERFLNIDFLNTGESDFFKDLGKSNIKFFSSGRSAIYDFFKNEFSSSSVFFPDFYCMEMLNPIIKAGVNIVFYTVRENLTADTEILGRIKNVKWIYINDYCGFRDNGLVVFAKERGMKIIFDRTHSLYSKFDFSNDVQIGSLRKLLPVPDGGILLNSRRKDIKRKRDSSFYLLKLNAKLRRHIYEEFNSNEKIEMNYVRLSEESEKKIKINSKNISLYSEKILSAYDVKRSRELRRKNFKMLLSSKTIKERAVIKGLDSLTVPQSFPMYVEKRDEVKKILAKDRIFAPVLWRGENSISKRIINIPVDEEYTESDMIRIIQGIEKILKTER